MSVIASSPQIVRMPRGGMRADFTHPILNGCVAWWPLTDGSGSSPVDVSGNSETLTNGGSSEWGVQSVGNVAVTNNNTGAYYSSDSAFSTMIGGSTPATDPWTISFWASLYITAPVYYEDGFLSIGSSAADGTPFLIAQRHYLSLRVYWGGAYTNISGVSNRTWANVTITFDGTAMNCYVDGSLGGTRTSAGTNGSTSDKLWIGTGYNNNNTAPDDYLQNVRVWDRALNSDEITLLYTQPWTGLEPLSPFAFYTTGAPAGASRFLINGFRSLLINGGLVQ